MDTVYFMWQATSGCSEEKFKCWILNEEAFQTATNNTSMCDCNQLYSYFFKNAEAPIFPARTLVLLS